MPSSSPPIHLHRHTQAPSAYVSTIKSKNASNYVLVSTPKTKSNTKSRSSCKHSNGAQSRGSTQIKQRMMSPAHKVSVGQLTNKMNQYKMTLHKLNKVVTSQKLKLQTMESKRNKMKLRHREQLKQKQEQIDALLMERELLRKQISDTSSASSSNEDEHEHDAASTDTSRRSISISRPRRIAPPPPVVAIESRDVNVLCADRLTSDEEDDREQDTVMAVAADAGGPDTEKYDDVAYRLQQEKLQEYEQQLRQKQGEIERYRLLMAQTPESVVTVCNRAVVMEEVAGNDRVKRAIQPRCVPHSIHSILSLLLGG